MEFPESQNPQNARFQIPTLSLAVAIKTQFAVAEGSRWSSNRGSQVRPSPTSLRHATASFCVRPKPTAGRFFVRPGVHAEVLLRLAQEQWRAGNAEFFGYQEVQAGLTPSPTKQEHNLFEATGRDGLYRSFVRELDSASALREGRPAPLARTLERSVPGGRGT